MPNEALRAAILSRGLGLDGAAEGIGVDPKTVERWINGRTPYRRHQYALASLLGVDIRYLWPDARTPEQVSSMGQAEVLAIYPHRSVVPAARWMTLFRQAHTRLDLLAFSGFWLSEDREFHRLLEEKADAGVQIRILLGDPECAEVERRGEDGANAEPQEPRKAQAQQEETTGDENDSGEWGLLGLLGLASLAGLRKRQPAYESDTRRSNVGA